MNRTHLRQWGLLFLFFFRRLAYFNVPQSNIIFLNNELTVLFGLWRIKSLKVHNIAVIIFLQNVLFC